MTVCIPKKPFTIAITVIYQCMIWSWIPIIGVCIYESILQNDLYFMIFAFPGCFIQFMIWIIWFHDTNLDKHWVKWCDTKSEERQP